MVFKFEDLPEELGSNKGWVVRKCTLFVDDVEVGYLKFTRRDKELTMLLTPHILDYLGMRGWCTKSTDLAGAWFRLHCHLLGYPMNQRLTNEEKAVAAQKLLDEHAEQLEGIRQEDLKDAGYTYVDYIRVYDDHQRKGYGLALYSAVADFLAAEGRVLTASSLQSPSAQACWAVMAERGFMLTSMRVNGEKRTQLQGSHA